MENIQNQISWILQEKYKGKLTAAAKKDIERLKAGEPLDYIIGFADFLGCKILVDENVLIPRVETEYWAEQAIGEMNKTLQHEPGKNLRILDIFSGSGALGIAALKQVPGLLCDFADSQMPCIKQITKNCKINNINQKRFHVFQSDVFEKVGGRYDYILANPPYIPVRRKHKIQESVLRFEPEPALFGGDDGLLYIKIFLTDAKRFLNPNGKIYMEFDSIQKPAIQTLLKKLSYGTFTFHKDQYGKWRYAVIS